MISLRVEGLTPMSLLRPVRLILLGKSKYPLTTAVTMTSSCLPVRLARAGFFLGLVVNRPGRTSS